MAKVINLAAPQRFFGLYNVNRKIYLKVTGNRNTKLIDPKKASVWNTRSAAEVWLKDATSTFGEGWEVVEITINAEAKHDSSSNKSDRQEGVLFSSGNSRCYPYRP